MSTNNKTAMVIKESSPYPLGGRYDDFMREIPEFHPDDPFLDAKISYARLIMQKLAFSLMGSDLILSPLGEPGTLTRTTLAIKDAGMAIDPDGPMESAGPRMVLGHWGPGMKSPVHGHDSGYMHESILLGKMRRSMFRVMESGKVRLVRTDVVHEGELTDVYNSPLQNNKGTHGALVHQVTALGPVVTLSLIPNPPRNGKGNTYEVEYFEDHNALTSHDVTRITGQEGRHVQPGDVILVRSSNTPEYGDHYMVVTGGIVMKPWGSRPQQVAIEAHTDLLDQYIPQMGVTLLLLGQEARERFLSFHGITVQDGQVSFPKAD